MSALMKPAQVSKSVKRRAIDRDAGGIRSVAETGRVRRHSKANAAPRVASGETPLKIEYVQHALFEKAQACEKVEALRPPNFRAAVSNEIHAGGNLNPRDRRVLQVPLGVPLLTREEERYLFLRMNLLKFQAARLQQRIARSEAGPGLAERVEALLAEAVELRNRIVEANLRLVISVARQFASAMHPLDELFSECQFSLIRSIELFDVEQGNSFSTYATHSIRNALGRSVQQRNRASQRAANADSRLLDTTTDPRPTVRHLERRHAQHADLVRRYLSCLPDRERQIVSARFGLDGGAGELTFREVGRLFGISKERVRVLTNRALARMQEVARSSDVAVIDDPTVDV